MVWVKDKRIQGWVSTLRYYVAQVPKFICTHGTTPPILAQLSKTLQYTEPYWHLFELLLFKFRLGINFFSTLLRLWVTVYLTWGWCRNPRVQLYLSPKFAYMESHARCLRVSVGLSVLGFRPSVPEDKT